MEIQMNVTSQYIIIYNVPNIRYIYMRWSLQWQILFHFSFKISGLEKSLKLSLPLVSRHQSTHDMIRMDVAPPAGFMREINCHKYYPSIIEKLFAYSYENSLLIKHFKKLNISNPSIRTTPSTAAKILILIIIKQTQHYRVAENTPCVSIRSLVQ